MLTSPIPYMIDVGTDDAALISPIRRNYEH